MLFLAPMIHGCAGKGPVDIAAALTVDNAATRCPAISLRDRKEFTRWMASRSRTRWPTENLITLSPHCRRGSISTRRRSGARIKPDGD